MVSWLSSRLIRLRFFGVEISLATSMGETHSLRFIGVGTLRDLEWFLDLEAMELLPLPPNDSRIELQSGSIKMRCMLQSKTVSKPDYSNNHWHNHLTRAFSKVGTTCSISSSSLIRAAVSQNLYYSQLLENNHQEKA